MITDGIFANTVVVGGRGFLSPCVIQGVGVKKAKHGIGFPPFKATSVEILPNYQKYALPHIFQASN